MKKTIILIALVLIVVAGVVFYFYTQNPSNVPMVEENKEETATTTEDNLAEKEVDKTKTIIGKSVEGRDIEAYHFGEGEKDLLFVGGIHGGYEWNTSLVAYELVDYLKTNPDEIPGSIRVTVIPVLNPDGLDKIVGTYRSFSKSDVKVSLAESVPGRFNANNVDLNRNFECDWQTSGTWQNKTVSGGSEVFSEPESQVMRDYIKGNKPDAVVVWYSSAGGVFASSCHNGVLPETLEITNTYAKAAGYPAYKDFNFYEITGDMVNWLAKNNIPAISVLLTNHTDSEWTKNLAGVKALFEHYK